MRPTLTTCCICIAAMQHRHSAAQHPFWAGCRLSVRSGDAAARGNAEGEGGSLGRTRAAAAGRWGGAPSAHLARGPVRWGLVPRPGPRARSVAAARDAWRRGDPGEGPGGPWMRLSPFGPVLGRKVSETDGAPRTSLGPRPTWGPGWGTVPRNQRCSGANRFCLRRIVRHEMRRDCGHRGELRLFRGMDWAQTEFYPQMLHRLCAERIGGFRSADFFSLSEIHRIMCRKGI